METQTSAESPNLVTSASRHNGECFLHQRKRVSKQCEVWNDRDQTETHVGARDFTKTR
jgi:hypothetical protein